jgi:hypothetical protein
LCLHGEQGSAKSTTARVLRSLIDPNTAPIRAEPRDTRDLAIAANNGWMVCLDNISSMPRWLSDALCRLSTGGGFATRTLYENDEETIFNAQRPVILNGIEEPARESDLMDRAILVALPRIGDNERKTEKRFWDDFDASHARLLGAILDAVAAGIRNLPSVHIAALPRMADFAMFAVAAEPALGLASGAFLEAYRGNRESANELVLEGNSIASHVVRLLGKDQSWEGTASDLLSALGRLASETTTAQRDWPKNPRKLSGDLRKLQPNLRQAGIDVKFERRKQRFIRLERTCVTPSAPSPPSHEPDRA